MFDEEETDEVWFGDNIEPEVVCEWDKRQKCDSLYISQNKKLKVDNTKLKNEIDQLKRVNNRFREWLKAEKYRCFCDRDAYRFTAYEAALIKFDELEKEITWKKK